MCVCVCVCVCDSCTLTASSKGSGLLEPLAASASAIAALRAQHPVTGVAPGHPAEAVD